MPVRVRKGNHQGSKIKIIQARIMIKIKGSRII
jgi:hypothetical protein